MPVNLCAQLHHHRSSRPTSIFCITCESYLVSVEQLQGFNFSLCDASYAHDCRLSCAIHVLCSCIGLPGNYHITGPPSYILFVQQLFKTSLALVKHLTIVTCIVSCATHVPHVGPCRTVPGKPPHFLHPFLAFI